MRRLAFLPLFAAALAAAPAALAGDTVALCAGDAVAAAALSNLQRIAGDDGAVVVRVGEKGTVPAGCTALGEPGEIAESLLPLAGTLGYGQAPDTGPLAVAWWTPSPAEQDRFLDDAGAALVARIHPLVTVVQGVGDAARLAQAVTAAGHPAVYGWAPLDTGALAAATGGKVRLLAWTPEVLEHLAGELSRRGSVIERESDWSLVTDAPGQVLAELAGRGLVAAAAPVTLPDPLDLAWKGPVPGGPAEAALLGVTWAGLLAPPEAPAGTRVVGSVKGGEGETAALLAVAAGADPLAVDQEVLAPSAAGALTLQAADRRRGSRIVLLPPGADAAVRWVVERTAARHGDALLAVGGGWPVQGLAVGRGGVRAEPPSGVRGTDREVAEAGALAGWMAAVARDPQEALLAAVLARDPARLSVTRGTLGALGAARVALPAGTEAVALTWNAAPAFPGVALADRELVALIRPADGGAWSEVPLAASGSVRSVELPESGGGWELVLVAAGSGEVSYALGVVTPQACSGTPPTFSGVTSASDVDGCAATGIEVVWPAVDDWQDGLPANSPGREYSIERSDDGGSTWTVMGTGPDTYGPGHVFTWTDTTAPADVAVMYRVVARNADGCSSGDTVTVSATDSSGYAPVFAGIASASDVDGCVTSGVTLSWSAPSDWGDGGGASHHFQVVRDGTVIATLDGSATGYVDTEAPAGVPATYSVRAVNTCGLSSDGGASQSATNSDSASAPAFGGIVQAASPADAGPPRVELTWCPATPACGSGVTYNVYRSTSSGFLPGPATLLAAGVSGGYVDAAVTPGTDYYYVVRAEDGEPGHGGPANGGREDANTVELGATVRSATTTVVLFEDDFQGNARPRHHAWYKSYFSDDQGDDSFWWIVNDGSNDFLHFGQPDGSDYPLNADDIVILGGLGNGCETNGIEIPSMATNVTLTYRQQWGIRDTWSSWVGFDGAMLMVSTDGTTFTQVPSGSFTAGGYTHSYYDYCPPSTHPARWADVWAGSSAWTTVSVDLSAYAGQTIWLAWRVTTDCDTNDYGFDVDDIVLTADLPGTSPGGTPPEVSPPGAAQPAVVIRDDSSSTGYVLQFQEIPGATYNVYEGSVTDFTSWSCLRQGVSSSDPDYTASGGTVRIELTPSAGSRFYLVTAVASAQEGTAGSDSDGVERNPTNADCAP